MRFIVTHLTRMMKGYICVAGVDAATLQHVRPVLPGTRLKAGLLESRGGPFGMASVVDLGEVLPCGQPPEVEDVRFNPARVRVLEKMSGPEFWALLESLAQPGLQAAFGRDLKRIETTCCVDVGKGSASLGCVLPERPPCLTIDRMDRIRALITVLGRWYDFPVTDLRLYDVQDHQRPREDVVRGINERLAGGVRSVACLGLTRPFAAREEDKPLHWLQLNSLHLQDDPCWAG